LTGTIVSFGHLGQNFSLDRKSAALPAIPATSCAGARTVADREPDEPKNKEDHGDDPQCMDREAKPKEEEDEQQEKKN
jgi:hypothetical protein